MFDSIFIYVAFIIPRVVLLCFLFCLLHFTLSDFRIKRQFSFEGRIQLRNMASASQNDENFQLGQTDEFIIESKEIGNLQKIK